MAGLPPFNGFLSKEMFFTAMVNAASLNVFNMETLGVLFPIVAWIASVFTFIYSMILVFKTFTGKYQPEKLDSKPHEAPIGMLIPPIILASLVIIFGLFSNILSGSIIEPALASITPTLLGEHGAYHVHISYWHGWNIELFMTIGVIGIGLIMFLTLLKWSKVYDYLPKRLTLNNFYDGGLVALDRSATKLNRFYMTGFIRDYLVIIFAFLIVTLTSTLFIKGALKFGLTDVAPVGIYEVILAIALIAGTITILFSKSRLTSIIALGAVGYTVSLFFVLFRAPDLALTQLIVETVSVALFLLCFYHLPKLQIKQKRLRFRMTNFVISLGVGTVVTLIALSSQNSKLFDSISSYFVESSYTEGGGKNMVNVILVDFRGFDTLFEITVLGIAALGIYSMIKLRLTRGKEG
jgi:multicomponent Na+:H+ antiporter subunit A